MGNFLSALSFLTILPIGQEKLAHSSNTAFFFPLIGLLIGILAYGVDWFATTLLFPEIRALVIVLFLALITGGLHLDGLADSADGLLSHRPKEDMLRIMRDPRIGTMGTLVLVFCLGFKVAAISALSGPGASIWIITAPALGRAALTAGLVRYPHARPEGGTHSVFYNRKSLPLLGLVWIPFVFPLLQNPVSGIGVLLVSISVFILFNRFVCLKLGGITGDTLGALCEIMETAILLYGAFVIAKGF